MIFALSDGGNNLFSWQEGAIRAIWLLPERVFSVEWSSSHQWRPNWQVVAQLLHFVCGWLNGIDWARAGLERPDGFPGHRSCREGRGARDHRAAPRHLPADMRELQAALHWRAPPWWCPHGVPWHQVPPGGGVYRARLRLCCGGRNGGGVHLRRCLLGRGVCVRVHGGRDRRGGERRTRHKRVPVFHHPRQRAVTRGDVCGVREGRWWDAGGAHNRSHTCRAEHRDSIARNLCPGVRRVVIRSDLMYVCGWVGILPCGSLWRIVVVGVWSALS